MHNFMLIYSKIDWSLWLHLEVQEELILERCTSPGIFGHGGLP